MSARVFCTLLYSAKCSTNLRAGILMHYHAKEHKGISRFYRSTPTVVEFLTGYSNLLLGYYYIRQVADAALFESIVYGFVVTETPELILKFIS